MENIYLQCNNKIINWNNNFLRCIKIIWNNIFYITCTNYFKYFCDVYLAKKDIK